MKRKESRCLIFIDNFFNNKSYSLTISKNTKIDEEKLKRATLEGLLNANSIYLREYNLSSIYDFKYGTSFLDNKIHEVEIQKRMPEHIQETKYASSVSGQYKIFVMSEKLSEECFVNKSKIDI